MCLAEGGGALAGAQEAEKPLEEKQWRVQSAFPPALSGTLSASVGMRSRLGSTGNHRGLAAEIKEEVKGLGPEGLPCARY